MLLSSLELALGLAFLLMAVGVVLKRPWMRGVVEPVPSSRTARGLLAAAFGLPAFGLLAGLFVPFLAFFASAMTITVTTVVGIASRLSGARLNVPGAIALIIAAVGIAALQPLGLKVLLLPNADKLPYVPVPSRVIKTYDPGMWFEGVSVGADGTLYLAANRDLDFTIGKYYRRAEGQVIVRKPDGTEQILFTTPRGSTAGVIAVGDDGMLYMTSNGDQPGLWKINPHGQASKFVELPKGAWPNGLDFGPDGMLYSPDSSLGQIWRIDPMNGHAEVALRDRRLSARAFVALAPGANGLHFVGRDMVVTVSDSTEVLRYHLQENGHFGRLELIARGIPGDDFAVGRDGSLFITTHPYNTLVRVMPDGRRTIIADQRQQIIGATDAVFGRSPTDRDTLYVVTDGGAFTGGPKTRGALIALEPYAKN